MEIVTTIANIALVIITMATVFVARRNLIAIDSPRLVVKKFTEKSESENNTIRFIASVKNYGNGIALRTFLLVIDRHKDGEDQYYLSKPVTNIESNEVNEIDIILQEEDYNNKFSFLTNEIEAYIISQDFFNNLYYTNASFSREYEHLRGFVKPIKQVHRFSKVYRRIQKWMKKSSEQRNTYVDRSIRKDDRLINEIDYMLKNTEWKKKNKYF